MGNNHALVACLAFASAAVPAAFASDSARLDKVGELDSLLERQHQARVKILRILIGDFSDTRKIELLGEFLHHGDTSDEVQKVLGRPIATRALSNNNYVAYFEFGLEVGYHYGKATAICAGPKTGWHLPDKSP